VDDAPQQETVRHIERLPAVCIGENDRVANVAEERDVIIQIAFGSRSHVREVQFAERSEPAANRRFELARA
jgi:hypothetical protein